MKKSVFFLIFCLLVPTFFLFSCSKHKTNQNTKEALFQENQTYTIEAKLGEWNGSAKLYCENDSLRLIHTDLESPTYEMEEIFTKDGFITNFQGISYKTSPSPTGMGLIYFIRKTIGETEPLETTKENDQIHYTYENEFFSFVMTKNKKDMFPIVFSGKEKTSYFEIKIQNLT